MNRIFSLIASIAFVSLYATAQGDAPEKATDKKVEHQFPLKSLSAFHDILHPLVHTAYPAGDYGTIKERLDVLLKKGIAIRNSHLPKKYASKEAEFQIHTDLLVTQLQSLIKSRENIDDKTFEKKFLEMHDQFERLTGLLTE